MPQPPNTVLRLSDLAAGKPTGFELVPTSAERKAIAETLGITAIKKLRFSGTLTPQNKRDWLLRADLGVTVVQPCVVTLAPVTTRIDERIGRNYMANLPEIDAAELEMPEDDTVEPLPETLDLVDVMVEALALAIPQYPRADDAGLDDATFAPPGITPLTDEAAKPFAGLGALRESLENKDK